MAHTVRLAPGERAALCASRWFEQLAPSLRHDLLRVLRVRRHADGEGLFARGDEVSEWLGCAAGAVRIASTTPAGKSLTLTFVRPGRWFGDPPLGSPVQRSHDAFAQGPTTTVAVTRADLLGLLREHPEFALALVQLQGHRLRQAFGLIEELSSVTLRARLARQLLHLMRGHGQASQGGEVRIGLRLRQHLLAELLGCSRQRVNEQLRELAAQEVIRRDKGLLVVRSPGRLQDLAMHGEA
ncbi:Crp/Fnr family transcriptional regulator [Ramlibacter rhizophilus]|uniref:Crp/Fnr family transcriptional regulator n=1 Tax=Ramlibacter rhizophilus TaxID=1781167 RepID=A0A4Z0BYW5_9BURK|nr:Crp/Fnr family transcriptional regulator [Ramlibacter rhizophilus]TFZ03488.1 Crp/Fnr family transcriptional regulator [Ramlibacter rhizophilus]